MDIANSGYPVVLILATNITNGDPRMLPSLADAYQSRQKQVLDSVTEGAPNSSEQ